LAPIRVATPAPPGIGNGGDLIMSGGRRHSRTRESKVKLAKALFTDSAISIYQVFLDEDWHHEDFVDWNLEPINAPILAAEYAREKLLDGEFILKAELVTAPGESEPCYLGITMPEGVVNYTYVLDLESDQVLQKTGRRKAAISLVAIEKLVDYEIYYSKADPEKGLDVLRHGFRLAKTKWPLAHAIACILRDEGRYGEAVDMLSFLINEGPSDLNYYNYQDRAILLELIGDAEGALRDRDQAEQILKASCKSGNKPI
jgi:tetratricopeptide (TPR) repeat protein